MWKIQSLGRTYEAGEKTENLVSSPQFTSIFGALVGGQFMSSVVDDLNLTTWINGNGPRKEVTRSFYDENQLQIAALPSSPQEVLNQRNRIISVTYEDVFDGDSLTYKTASHYAYDIHGNVKTLLQENPEFENSSLLQAQRMKKMDYTYDLVSGNVHRVDYQNGKVDEWHHAYRYDADNRITEVYTTKQTPMANPAYGMAAAQNEPLISPFWEKDASYEYYKHGPLARVEIGNEKVQGVDYVYTAQGWLKAVNSNTLQADRDPGKDGDAAGSSTVNALVAKDVYGFSLHYNDNDYKPIATSSSSFVASQTGSDVYNNGAKLYNGNIGRMVTTITKPDTREVLPLGNAYQYDQLNRLATSKSFANLNLSNNSWGNTGTYDNKYYNAFNYDANGNILSQVRHDSTGNKIDDLTYNYEKNFAGRLLRNRLYQVNDLVSDATYADDIDDMGTFDNNVNSINIANNYSYDGEGRLVKDRQEEIDTIIWRVDGKVKEIQRTSGSIKKNLTFDYDPMGRRTAKKIYSSSNVFEKAVYYSLDAQGNVMTTYEMNIDTANTALDFYQTEKFIYGSSRLGMLKDSVNVLGSAYGNTDTSNFVHTLGNKLYELSNHLGNVLTVISDKPIPHNNGGTVDYFMADIKSAQDYSPFGVTLSGRDFNSAESKYGFVGQEKDDEVKGRANSYDFGSRMYDSRLGRWWIKDAFEVFYTSVSPYSYALNNPISNIDIEGNFVIEGTVEQKNQLTKVINATKKALATNPYLLERLKLHSGLTEDEINWLLTDGEGPVLNFKTLKTNTYGEWEGLQSTRGLLSKSVSVKPSYFTLSLSSIFEETDILDDNNRFLLVMIILHEFTHIGDHRNGKQGDVINYSDEVKTKNLNKNFIEEAKRATIDAKYDPSDFIQGIEVGKGLEIDLTGYAINNDDMVKTRRKAFEYKSNQYDKKKRKENGEKKGKSAPKSQPRF